MKKSLTYENLRRACDYQKISQKNLKKNLGRNYTKLTKNLHYRYLTKT